MSRDDAHIASLIRWWQDAGVASFVGETPQAWPQAALLMAVEPAPASADNQARQSVPPPTPLHIPNHDAPLPETLDALMAYYAASPELNGLDAANRRILPTGNPTAALMILIDMPAQADAAAGHLLAGETGALFDNMLKALKLDRSAIWFAAMTPSRMMSQMISPALDAKLAAFARQHVQLIAPKKLWLLGRAASRAIIGMNELEAGSRLHQFALKEGHVDVIASVHPQVLLQTPKRKAEVWAAMQKLMQSE